MLDTLRLDTQALLERYLQQYPAEAAALAPLAGDLAAGTDCFNRSTVPAHVTTSAAVLSPDRRHVLLIHHKVIDAWIPPGGHYEGEGTLWESAVREVEEETGVTGIRLHRRYAGLGIPIDIDTHATPARACRGEPAHQHHDFRYLAVLDTDCELVPQAAEVHGARWARLRELANSDDRRLTTLYAKLQPLFSILA